MTPVTDLTAEVIRRTIAALEGKVTPATIDEMRRLASEGEFLKPGVLAGLIANPPKESTNATS